MDRRIAHLLIVAHVPGPDWRWFGLRSRCRYCGQRVP
jgi:hypothetical protein